MFIKSGVLGLIIFGLSQAPIALAGMENDLSTFKQVRVEATLLSAYDQPSGEIMPFLHIHSPYTNTLSCAVNVSVRIEREDGRFFHKSVKLRDLEVFPKAVFGFDGMFAVPLTLGNGEFIPNDLEENLTVSCYGRDASRPLQSICSDRKINPSHDKACAMLSDGKGQYPLIINDAWLGSCQCG
jgi:hypothetical protein